MRQGHDIGEAVLRHLMTDAARAHVPVSLAVLRGNPHGGFTRASASPSYRKRKRAQA
nr:hypothetical protein [Burkholderia sp. AU19243]